MAPKSGKVATTLSLAWAGKAREVNISIATARWGERMEVSRHSWTARVDFVFNSFIMFGFKNFVSLSDYLCLRIYGQRGSPEEIQPASTPNGRCRCRCDDRNCIANEFWRTRSDTR